MVKKVGKYEMGRTLGEGTFGKVKHAVNSETNEVVAIKVLDKDKIQKQQMGNQIKREISIMKMVKHRYIVEMIEVLASKTKIFIVIELVSGGELFDKIVREGKFSEEKTLFYFNQLAEGVEYCHKVGVCHRDLKPENLLLDEHGNLKISDFGLSSLYVGDADGDSASRTELLHTTCGTPNYVAPEVLADKGYDGKKADVWSIGVIVYVMLAGFLPFDENNIVALFAKIQAADYTYPSFFNSEARAVLDTMLVVDPKVRASLSQLRAHPWLHNYATTHMANGEATNGSSDGPVEAIAAAVADTNVTAESHDVDDDHDVDEDEDHELGTIGRKTGNGPRSLNAFDLVAQCGGFSVDKLFSPNIFASLPSAERGLGLSGLSGLSNMRQAQQDPAASSQDVAGVLKFGATQTRSGRFNFTSPIVPAINLVEIVHTALGECGCDISVSLEKAKSTGSIRATKMTPKGMVGIGVNIFDVCSTLSLLEIKRGKGDLFEWNKLYVELVSKKLSPSLNKVEEEGEAKMESSKGLGI